ncbi:MAG: DUF1800 family protein [Verrucomicrobiota bacterium]|nr:DUF1800 family protein [Verrucomicrobiota bacterium]
MKNGSMVRFLLPKHAQIAAFRSLHSRAAAEFFMNIFLRQRTAAFVFALLAIGGLAAPAHAISNAVNISTRMVVQTGDNVLITGFIVTGTGQKKIALRAIGPSVPVAGALADPFLELHDASGKLLMSNNDWRTTQQDAIIAAGLAPKSDLESALITSLAPGSYTAIVRGMNNGTGVGLVELYDLDGDGASARLGNLSTRGNVLAGDNVMIGGFIVRGDAPKKMIARARGPSLFLNGTPIPDSLSNPNLELHDADGALLAQNDDWQSTQRQEIEASSLAPTDPREPAIVASLAPGLYTAIVRGAGSTTGIALVEFYDLDQPPQADGSTLYLTQMRPQGTGTSHGSGTSTLRLSADGTYAIITVEYSNLTGPITGMHIHGPADPGQSGGILFDIDAATPQPDGTYIWVFAPTGNNSVADIVNAIKSGRTYVNVHTAAYPAGEINGFFHLSTGAQTAPVPTPPPALAPGPPTSRDAARFLTQSTFGATDALIAGVQNQGFDGFLNDQFNVPASSHLAFVDAAVAAFPTPAPGATPMQPSITQTNDAWWTYAIAGQDQLRQRVAFALSEIMVVSLNSAGLGNKPFALPAYYDVLVRNAFGNYRQLLEEMTLNPAMGAYLNMLQNDKANPSKGTLPNENYAREIMQLFSIGLYQLNLDGSLTLNSSGFPIPTYDQGAILGTAAVFTGWTYAQTGTPVFFPGGVHDYRNPMVNVATHHSLDAKTILNGVLVPANGSAAQDLQITLDTIFNHPNVGPYICQQLIQRLVTSNPSPGYVYRVASVFNNNGQGVRGDLKAVVRAILTDYDARGLARTDQGAGKQREPVLRLTTLLRGLGASSADGKFSIRGADAAFAEEAMHSPTVFNFFSPDYESPGAITLAGLRSPEFEITTETTVVSTANYLRNAIYGYLGPSTDKVTLNLANEQTLAADPTQLVNHLNSLLMAGGMSPAMQTTLINAVNQIPATNPAERVKTALYLVVNSPEFVIEK